MRGPQGRRRRFTRRLPRHCRPDRGLCPRGGFRERGLRSRWRLRLSLGPQTGLPADDPLHGGKQRIKRWRSSTRAPVDQIGGLYASKPEWWLDRFEQDRDEDPSALPLARFLNHPIRCDGMERPGDHDAFGLDESSADMAMPRLARRDLAVPEDGKPALAERGCQLVSRRLILARITQKNVGPGLGLAQRLVLQSLSRL
jgi:hypothetical protein